MTTDQDATKAELGFGDYARAFGFAGAFAGALLASIEIADRIFALRHFLSGAARNAEFALSCTLTAPWVFLISAGAGVLLWLLGSALRAFRFRKNRTRELLVSPALTAKILIGAVVAVAVLVGAFPYIRAAFGRVAYHLQLERGADAEMFALLAPVLLILPLVAAAFVTRFLLAGQLRPVLRGLLFVVLALFAGGAYWVDSRWIVGLADDTVHLTATLGAAGAAIGCGVLVWVWLHDKGGRACRITATGLAVIFGLFCVCAVAGAARLNLDPVASALFWTRGVYAPRVAILLQSLVNRDGDGFAGAFGAPDSDDRDPLTNPLAREIPGDGKDQNGLGGDWTPVSEASDPTSAAFFSDVYIPPNPGPGRRNVLFISIDALRADHLSAYGYRRPVSPNMDAFAARCVLYERTIAQATSTGHSFASMMTGAYGDRIFDPEQPRLGSLLAASGYQTCFLNSAPFRRFINRDDYWLYYRDIMSDGFQPLDNEDHTFRAADRLTDDAIAYLGSVPQDRSHFTWIHYRDPHAGYVRHKEFDYGSRAIDKYDSEIAFTDHHLARLLTFLEESGALTDTLVIITADHGESFGEHGDYTHHRRPYATLSHIPLVVWWPGVQPTRVASASAGVDIAPTIANWAGLTPESLGHARERFDGLDLRWQAAQPAGTLAGRAVVGETPRNCNEANFFAWALVTGDSYLIYDIVGPRIEYFDMAEDPLQRRNLATEQPEDRDRLLAVLGHWLDRLSQRPGYSGWAQMQPSFLSPAPAFPPAPQHGDRRRTRQSDNDDG